MILNIKREILLEELIKVSKIISQKTLIPSLLGILIEVKKDKILLITSDGEISIKSEIKISNNLIIKSIGKILIKNKYIIEIIKKIEDDFIILEKIENNLIKIKGKNFDSFLNTLDYNNYPNIFFNISGKKIELNNEKLKEIINQTYFAIGEKEKRIVFNGLNIKNNKKENKLIITATDSFRLAIKKIDYSFKEKLDVIIPGKFINEINKLILENNNNNSLLIINEKSICVKLNNLIIQSKIIEGKYPDTTKAIPINFHTILKIKNKELIKTIERVSALSNDLSSVIITLKINKNNIFVSSFINEIGNSEEKIENFHFSGIKQIISFNSKFFLDALKSFKIKNEEIIIKIVDESKPLIIISEKESTLQQLILPIRSY